MNPSYLRWKEAFAREPADTLERTLRFSEYPWPYSPIKEAKDFFADCASDDPTLLPLVEAGAKALLAKFHAQFTGAKDFWTFYRLLEIIRRLKLSEARQVLSGQQEAWLAKLSTASGEMDEEGLRREIKLTLSLAPA